MKNNLFDSNRWNVYVFIRNAFDDVPAIVDYSLSWRSNRSGVLNILYAGYVIWNNGCCVFCFDVNAVTRTRTVFVAICQRYRRPTQWQAALGESLSDKLMVSCSKNQHTMAI